MADTIRIKKGLDIHLKGRAEGVLLPSAKVDVYSICPDDFSGFVPKLLVKAGDKVAAGTIILYDKNFPEIKIASPVSGEILEVNRGEKRKLLNVFIKPDEEIQYVHFGKKDIKPMTRPEALECLSDAGLLPFFRQRPYDRIVNPMDIPRDIFVSSFFSAPLSPDFEYILKDQESEFQLGLDILKKLTSGKVYLGISRDCVRTSLKNARHAEVVTFDGPHPAGNVGVQINKISPINKGEVVWTISPTDVLFIGRLFGKGIADFSRQIAICGSEVKKTGYHKIIMGANIGNLVKNNVSAGVNLRIISGDVLTGKTIGADGFLGAFHNQITVIPEGNEVSEFFGWATLGLNKFSNSRTYFTWLLDPLRKKEYAMDARVKGGTRAIIMSNEYDKVFPMDIYPEYLLKSIIAFDIDKMENLGIYEIAPEDFALCEFVDTSKIEIQKIVRKGLDLLYKEMS